VNTLPNTLPNTIPVTISGQTAAVEFRDFGLDAYALFLRAKKLPEKQVSYDWRTDTYTLTTHRRFAAQLGTGEAAPSLGSLPLSEYLFDYQKFIVARAFEAARFAVFADTGLGKTNIFLEWARLVRHRTRGKMLILTMTRELVRQTVAATAEFYPAMFLRVLSTREELIAWCQDEAPETAICTISKMIPGLIPEFRSLAGLVLDESSILKTGGGVIKWNLIKSARGIEYKLSCTATPAPNDVMEYASQAAFLEKIRTEGEVFWTYFTRGGNGKNSSGKGDWTVKPHARRAFYEFMASWSFYIRSPKRFGFADNLADLPDPEFFDIAVPPTPEQAAFAMDVFARAGSGLFGDRALGVTWRTKLSQAAKGFVYDKAAPGGVRPVASAKPAVVASIVRGEVGAGRQVLVWTVFDEETRLLDAACRAEGVPVAVLDGGMKEEARGAVLDAFRAGRTPVMISKASLLGYGLNFQNVGSMVFSGWNDSYEQWYQAVRRAYRYGQTKRVRVFTPCVYELEGGILENVLRKKAAFEADAQAQEDCFLEVFRHAV